MLYSSPRCDHFEVWGCRIKIPEGIVSNCGTGWGVRSLSSVAATALQNRESGSSK